MPTKKTKENPGGRAFYAGPGGLDAEAFARWYRDEEIKAWQALDLKAVAAVAARVEKARDEGKQVFLAGNGGSAATASHLAVDWCKTAAAPAKPLLRCQSLCDNAAFMTAVGNDISYDAVFSRQLENFIGRGDLLVLISGSGNSPNVLEAAKLARGRGADVAAFVGFDGGRLKALADLVVHVKSSQYGVIEDLHLAAGSIIAFYLAQR